MTESQENERAARLELARRAFKEFYARCFWSYRSDLEITEDFIPFVVRGLREHGGEPLLAGLDRNLSASEAMLGEVRELSASLQGMLDDPDTRGLPANLNATLVELRETLQGLSPDSSGYRELTAAAERLERLMRDVQPAVRTVRDNPRALLFESLETNEDPMPRAPRRD